ncbi:MAG: D-2-hydroxyacid dehydrogenase family protein [Betaproteobacteria bacterium]|jgi:phosphoglycerate dehydrogenase-like enzyme|nr:D-2-hydroxyacid dehydrogenase family protein [Betaproteobacteria bacterium]NBP44229.1 D-2-hydroxyacid dehydrogenase family protein [Betaproteobacteria bacterium]
MRVAVLDDYADQARHFADWDSLGCEVLFFNDHLVSEDQLVERLASFEIVALMRERTPFPQSLIARLPHLKLIITTGRQNAAIDVKAAQAHGITVCGTQSPGHATAELAFLLILSLARQLVANVNGLQHGHWQAAMGFDCRGKTLGILGLGRLGTQVAQLGKTIGMKVLAWSQNLTPETCAALGVEWVSKQDLFARSDFVSIHVRLSDRTRALVGRDELAALGPQGYLVNTSRAEIVDQAALLDALNAGSLGGVATDVYVNEPTTLEQEALLAHPRALCTPHLGYVTRETYSVFYQETVAGIQAFLKGQPVQVIQA